MPLFLGSLKLAWTPPPWLHAAGRGITRHSHAAIFLLVTAAVSFGAWRNSLDRSAGQPPAQSATAAADATPSPAWPVTSSPKNADAPDTSAPRIRTVRGLVRWPSSGWDAKQNKPSKPVLVIDFDGPAAPLALIGKQQDTAP